MSAAGVDSNAPQILSGLSVTISSSSVGPTPQIYQEDMMRSLLQNSLHVFRAISGTGNNLG